MASGDAGGNDCSGKWISAIKDATLCLREQEVHFSLLDQSMIYLGKLEVLLRKREHQWDRPPLRDPPAFHHHSHRESGATNDLLVPSVVVAEREHRMMTRGNNPFGAFQDSDDESSSDEEDEEEAGDMPVMNVLSENSIDMRRLMIRILNAQSDIFAAKATCFRKSFQWSLGAEQYTHSLTKIHEALVLGDSEISRWIEAEEGMYGTRSSAKQALSEDVNIVSVAVQFLTEERDRYAAAARQQEHWLLRKLHPQWKSRDDIKRRMGDRWYNNPSPRQDYAAKREEAERQLDDVRRALQYLENLDTSQAERSARLLKERLQGNHIGDSSSQRYNLMRPTDISRRVDITLYPDPTDFGWTFTGSSGVVEFFERPDNASGGLIKLDWYFTTGTVKTSLDHPVQGKTQLFAAKVSPEMYRAILENPRVHTGKRYQRRRKNRHGKKPT
jgi:hypothetical protein